MDSRKALVWGFWVGIICGIWMCFLALFLHAFLISKNLSNNKQSKIMSTVTIPLIPASEANTLYIKASDKEDRVNCILSTISTDIRVTAESDTPFIYYRFRHEDLDLKNQIILTLEKAEYEVETPKTGENNVIKIIYG